MERPIYPRGPQIRAILEGRKTQTRRVMKPQPTGQPVTTTTPGNQFGAIWPYDDGTEKYCACPYGQPGDSLWVRETWAVGPWHRSTKPSELPPYTEVFYHADNVNHSHFAWRPSIFMPRWASRITLRVVNVRVERLQDISESDAIAEGIKQDANGLWLPGGYDTLVLAYRDLWDSIYGKTHPWNSNTLVWVLEFEKGQ